MAVPLLDCFALASLALAMTGNEEPSLRGGEAAEAIQAGGAACEGRAACRVAAPLLDCFARASRGLAMTGKSPSFSPALAVTGQWRRDPR